jgi:hypothetical protein
MKQDSLHELAPEETVQLHNTYAAIFGGIVDISENGNWMTPSDPERIVRAYYLQTTFDLKEWKMPDSEGKVENDLPMWGSSFLATVGYNFY